MSNQHTPNFHDPRPQPFYTFQQSLWQQGHAADTPVYDRLSPIKLISWNIDFQAPYGRERMRRALTYLQQLVASLPPEVPSVILLQEMEDEDLFAIQTTDWIRQNFHTTDINTRNWLSSYGTITLIDRRLRISSVFRVRYVSGMGRDALFVDIEDADSTTLRVGNTHLESLRTNPPLRPAQIRLASRYLRDPTADGAIIAGDFNAIEGFDQSLHTQNGLKDAYLESGGPEGHQDGWTWGMQSPGTEYGCTRLDKIMYCGRTSVTNMMRIGAGLQIEEDGALHFVTDHLGLMADINIEEL